MRVAIFGGNGFIGQHLAAELARRGHHLVLPVRNRERVKANLILLPNTDVFAYQQTVSATWAKSLAGVDVAVNLVGILNENNRHLFDLVHGEFVRRLMESCDARRIPRVIQISAIGAASGAPSAYLRSKAKAEQIIQSHLAVRHTIIRPSVVFGPGDHFINTFAAMLRFFPIIPLPGAAAEMQPIAVADMVSLIIRVLEDDSINQRILHVGGPAVLTLHQIVDQIAAAMHLRRYVIPLGNGLSYTLAAIMEKVPFVDLITRDNCLSMQVPSICPRNDNDALTLLGELNDLESGLRQL